MPRYIQCLSNVSCDLYKKLKAGDTLISDKIHILISDKALINIIPLNFLICLNYFVLKVQIVNVVFLLSAKAHL